MAFVNWSDLAETEKVPGFRARFVHMDRMTCSYWQVTAGARLPEHSHPHEQVSHVLSGRFELTVERETRVLEPGIVATIPSGVRHSGVALTDCVILDVFSPVREDYR